MKNLTVRVAAEEVAADDPEADDLVADDLVADDRSKETAAAVEAMIIDHSRETVVMAARAMMAREEARGPGMIAVRIAVAASRGNKGVMAAVIAAAAVVVGVLKERIARLNHRFRGCVCIFCRMKRG